jgi:hypothetical protein
LEKCNPAVNIPAMDLLIGLADEYTYGIYLLRDIVYGQHPAAGLGPACFQADEASNSGG